MLTNNIIKFAVQIPLSFLNGYFMLSISVSGVFATISLASRNFDLFVFRVRAIALTAALMIHFRIQVRYFAFKVKFMGGG